MTEESKKISTTQLRVNTGTIVGSAYAQIVGVSVSDSDATLEFIYINPQVKTEGQAVARVTLPRKALDELARVIPETLKKYDSTRKV